MAGNLQPLDQKFPIVKPDGKPTDYFIRWAQQRQIDITAGITAEQAVEIITQYLADHQLQEGSGISLSPSGNISDSPTVAAEVQAILDQITNVQGSVLFRGAAGWDELLPGTTGHFLKTNGAGANPEWAAGGGGGGATRPTVVQVGGVIANNFNVTMPSTPTAGNFLVAMSAHWNNLGSAGTGWILVENLDGGASDGVAIAMKRITSADTTAQVPFIGGVGGSSVVVFEVTDMLGFAPVNRARAQEDTVTPFDLLMTGSRNSSLIVGAIFRGGSNTAYTITTYTTALNITGTTANNSPRRVQGIHLNADKATNGNISLAFAGGIFAGALVELLGA